MGRPGAAGEPEPPAKPGKELLHPVRTRRHRGRSRASRESRQAQRHGWRRSGRRTAGAGPGSRASVTRTGTSEERVGGPSRGWPLTAVLWRSGGGGRALGVVRQVQEAGLPGGQQEASPARREGCFQLTCLPSQTVGPTGGGNTGIVRRVTRPSARLPRVIPQRGDSEEAPWAVGSKLCPSARCGALTEQHRPGLWTGALLTARGCAPGSGPLPGVRTAVFSASSVACGSRLRELWGVLTRTLTPL